MMNASEKLEALRERERLIRRARDKTIIEALSAGAVLMLVGVVTLISLLEGDMHPVGDTGQLGSSLLFQGAAGYVLTAVISFTAAVVIMALIRVRSRKKNNSSDPGMKSEK